MNSFTIAVDLAYLVAAAGFVVALHLMNSPATARKGSRLSWLGMIVAVAAALTSIIHNATITTTGWIVLAKSVIVIKRSMGHGYAGIDNELYTDPKTGMLFSDAKAGLAEIAASVKALVAS
jgi:NAD/NADP transhydrogenase beta subunit